MFLSANQERPGPDRMTLLIEDAARLWKDIPSENLHGAVEVAIIEAGSFTATNGLVAKLWAGRKPKESQADFHNVAGQMKVLPPLPPEEVRDELKRLAQEMQRQIGPGVRPKDWTP